MPKPKLLVILGAGSSVGQGIPSVGEVNSAMRNWAADWARIYTPATNFFERLWSNAEECYRVEPKPFLRRQPNFEKILGDLVSFSNWMRPHPYGETLRFLITPGNPAPRPKGFIFDPSGMRFPEGDMFEHTLVAAHSAYLLGHLAKYMRGKSRSFSRTSGAFTSYRCLFNALRSRFDVGIYNLNYDTVALEANPGMFYGFDTNGAFVPSQVHARRQWNFIYHLHGSVHHRLNGLGDRLEWVQDLSANFADGLPGRSGRDIADGKTIPKSTLIAGKRPLECLVAVA